MAANDSPPVVWALADDRAGNVAQCLGVAEALGLPFAVKDIRYGRAGALPNLLRGASLTGLTAEAKAALCPPWPQAVIAAGRRTAPVARWLKRRSGALIVQLMDPGPPGRGDFDLIAVPRHDARAPALANILRHTGAAHRVTAARLAAAAEEWRARLAHLPRPRVALVVGGATKERPFTPAQAAALGRLASAAVGAGSLMVTTSRRTGRDAEEALLAEIAGPRHVYRWGDGGDNPFFGYLALADAVIVTGDSVSMVCEACATAGPVYVFAPEGMVSAKHARLHRSLYEAGCARPFAGTIEDWRHPPLDPAQEIAARVRDLLAARRAA